MFRNLPLLFLSFLLSAQLLGAVYNVVDFGASGNALKVNTSEIQNAIDSCTITGGTVLIPSGTFVAGTLFLKNNVTLELEAGAVLKGSGWLWDYPVLNVSFVSSFFTDRALIFAEGANDIKITGTGIIDGSGSSASFLLPTNKAKRPFGIRLISCSNVTIENVTLKNSAFWMTQFLNCDDVYIHHVTVRNHSNSNNDGINIDSSRDVLVENCDIDSFDDAVCLKASSPVDCENIEVRNCVLASYNNVIKLGNETTGGFRNVNIHHCTVEYSSFGLGTTAAEAGIGIVIVDGGTMDSVTVSDIDMEGVDTPFFIYLGNYGSKYTSGIPDPPVGILKNVWLNNITARAASNITSWVGGIPGYYAQNIHLNNIYLKIPGGVPANTIVMPEKEKDKARSIMLGETFPCYGIFIRHVQNIEMDSICIETENADARDLLYLEDVNPVPSLTTVSSGPVSCLYNSVVSYITDHAAGNSFDVYPNPASDVITINIPGNDFTATIFNAIGEIIYSSNMTGTSPTINVKEYPAGIYSVVLQNEQTLFVKKLVLSK